MNGKPASFLAGGEFPFPIFQPSANGHWLDDHSVPRVAACALNFTPNINAARDDPACRSAPEVSALDFTSGLVVQGLHVPALTGQQSEYRDRAGSGQSFAIAGLIDNKFTETISKIPFLGDVPVLGKLFQSKSQDAKTIPNFWSS